MTSETSSHNLTKDLISKLEQLKALEFSIVKGQYSLIIDKAEDFLILCYKIGSNPSFTPDEAIRLGPLINDALLDVSAYLFEKADSLEEIDIDIGKAARSGLQFLLTEISYRNLPLSAGKTLSESLQDFVDNECEMIEEFDDHLKALEKSLNPCYVEVG